MNMGINYKLKRKVLKNMLVMLQYQVLKVLQIRK